MRLTMIGVAVGLTVLAGCDGSTEPAQPPTQEDALTTATVAPPTPNDEVDVTTEAAPTTAEPTTTEPTTTEPTQEVDAGEQTEGGAQSAVESYVETLAAVHARDGDIEELRKLATPECQTCAAFVQAAEKERFGHEYMRYIDSEAFLTGDEAIVHTRVEQAVDDARIDLVFTLDWEGEQWLISKIQVQDS